MKPAFLASPSQHAAVISAFSCKSELMSSQDHEPLNLDEQTADKSTTCFATMCKYLNINIGGNNN
jgi:hypothetical protein